jgi:hypothetical protein
MPGLKGYDPAKGNDSDPGTECCRLTYGAPGRGGAMGWGACCNGQLFICTFAPTPQGSGGGRAQPKIADCAKAHEMSHFQQGDFEDCSQPGPPRVADFGPNFPSNPDGTPDRPSGEIPEMLAEIGCLDGKINQCGTGTAGLGCEQEIRKRMDELAQEVLDLVGFR